MKKETFGNVSGDARDVVEDEDGLGEVVWGRADAEGGATSKIRRGAS